MKRKFFWTIFGVLAISMVAVSGIYTFFIRIERLHLIDQRIEVVASNIMASGLEQEDTDAMSEVISETLDEEPTLSLVTLYAKDHKILFRNSSAKTILGDQVLDTQPQRMVHMIKDRSVRVINFPISVEGMTLQVGSPMDSDFIHWRSLNMLIIRYLVVVFLLGLVIASYLSQRLLRPLRALSSYLTHVTGKIGTEASSEEMPHVLGRELRKNGRDEFSELIRTSHSMTEKLTSRFQLSQRTAAQMAHELKTPLTLIRNMVESNQPKDKSLAEIDRLSTLVQNFLTWSRFAFGLQNETPIHAVKVLLLVRATVSRFASSVPERIKLVENLEDGFRLFCDPELLDQAMSNLIDNALKYSPSGSLVTIFVNEAGFEVRDTGPGLSSDVQKRIGEPFNSGDDSRKTVDPEVESFGLGLAWVDSIVQAYGWKLSFRKTSDHFSATISWTVDDGAVARGSI